MKTLYAHCHWERPDGRKDTFYTCRLAYRQFADGRLFACFFGSGRGGYFRVPKRMVTRRKSGEVIRYVWVD